MRGICFCNTAPRSTQRIPASSVIQGKNGHYIAIFHKSGHIEDTTQTKALNSTDRYLEQLIRFIQEAKRDKGA